MSDANDDAAKAAAEKEKAKKAAEEAASKVTLTKEELDAQLTAAVAKVEAKFKKEQEEAKRKADEDAAKQKGEFQKLYESEVAARKAEQADRDRLKLDMRGKDVDLKLRDALAEKHPEYLAAARWIKPAISFAVDTDDAALSKSIGEAVEQYVKDNPRTPKPGTLPPVRKQTVADSTTKDDATPRRVIWPFSRNF